VTRIRAVKITELKGIFVGDDGEQSSVSKESNEVEEIGGSSSSFVGTAIGLKETESEFIIDKKGIRIEK